MAPETGSVDSLVEAGATVTEGPVIDRVRWLRVTRHAGGTTHYVAERDQVGLERLADTLDPDPPANE